MNRFDLSDRWILAPITVLLILAAVWLPIDAQGQSLAHRVLVGVNAKQTLKAPTMIQAAQTADPASSRRPVLASWEEVRSQITTNLLKPSPADEIQAAWRRAQKAGVYHFATEIEQTTYPAPRVTNVGRSSRVDTLYLEGDTNLPEHAMQMTLWQNGGSILDPGDGIEMRIEGDQAYGRQTGGTWQKMDDISSSFAPGSDLMAYLAGIKNVRKVGEKTLANHRQVINYTFDVDGPAFGRYLRRQLERQLRERGELPAGLTLDVSNEYRNIIGNGQVWLDSDGLPRRLTVHLEYPQQPNGERIAAEIKTDFSQFDHRPLLAMNGSPTSVGVGGQLGSHLGSGLKVLAHNSRLFSGLAMLLIVVLFGVWMISHRQSRKVYATFAISLTISMVITPLLQSQQISAFYARQRQKQTQQRQAQEATAVAQEWQDALLSSDWDPHRDPLQISADSSPIRNSQSSIPNSQSAIPASTSDADHDGLTYAQEVLLGTDPDKADSDGDLLRDDLEVKGFDLGGQHWYSDPSSPDSNNDGLLDTMECWGTIPSAVSNTACDLDTDGDGTPNLFDRDNDNDGVSDRVDSAPNKVVPGFSDATPLKLVVDNLQAKSGKQGYPVFVDFQIRPNNPDHLAYAMNVLDWPSGDRQGQIKRVKDNTLASLMNPQPPSDNTNWNGDMRLVPMLEIKIPASSGQIPPLPLTAPQATRQIEGWDGTTRWISATLTLKQQGGNTTINFQLEGATSGVTAEYFASACPAESSSRVWTDYDIANGNIRTHNGQNLTKLVDGKHSVVLRHGDNAVCTNLGDIPNGPYSDKMIDTAKLQTEGVSVRDADDKGNMVAYVPLNLTSDETGGSKVAFSARMVYWPNSVSTWGKAHEVRVIWLVQALTDSCKPTPKDWNTSLAEEQRRTAWCLVTENWTTHSPSPIHTYPEDWSLTGLSVREDRGMEIAVAYEDPAHDNDKKDDSRLWKLADGLQKTFTSPRDENGNKVRDIGIVTSRESRTVADETIQGRFDNQSNSSVSTNKLWGIPRNALRVQTYSYPHQDYLAKIPSEITPDILKHNFSHDDAPTLLFAREEYHRTANLDMPDGIIDEKGSQVTVDMSSSKVPQSTLAAMSWGPYRYRNGQWEAYPLDKYWDKMAVQYKKIFKENPPKDENGVPMYSVSTPDAEVVDGLVTASQAYYISMVQGSNKVVAFDYVALVTAKVRGAVADASLAQSTVNSVGAGLELIANQVSGDFISLAKVKDTEAFQNGVARIEKAAKTKKMRLRAISRMKRKPSSELKAAMKQTKRDNIKMGAKAGLSVAALSMSVAASYTGEPVLKNITNGLAAVSEIVDTAETLQSVAKAWRGAKTAATMAGKASSFSGTYRAASNAIAKDIHGSSMKAGIVLTVIAIAVTMGVFIAVWAEGGYGTFGGLQFNAALSGMIATIIATVIMFAISLIPIVGQIIAAVIAVIDALIQAVCAIADAVTDETEDFVFDLALQYQSDLNAGTLSNEFRQQYIIKAAAYNDGRDADEQLPAQLSTDISIEKKTDSKWIVTDNGAGQKFIIRKKSTKLKVNIPGNSFSKGGFGKWFCKGISGLFTYAIQWSIYSQTSLVGNLHSDSRTQTMDFHPALVDAKKGFSAGNQVKYSLEVVNAITLADVPFDWKAALYAWQYTYSNLNTATVKHVLKTSNSTEKKNKIKDVKRGQLKGTWQRKSKYLDDETALVMSEPLSKTLTLDETGINRSVALYLAEAYAVPTQECWLFPVPPLGLPLIPVCYIRTDNNGSKTTFSDLGKSMKWDVFPATLDGFYACESGNPSDTCHKDGGYSLGWGQTGDLTFPRMKDFDGDGLLNKKDGGNDPNDSKWDTDGDGLSDPFEIQNGSDPTLADSDGDGLSDYDEARLGTNPNRQDTDGDGLTDKQEIDGWEFVYALMADRSQLKTWVTSDPLSIDGDGDTLTDFQEKVYGFNPRVKSDLDLLDYSSKVIEPDAPVMLLRFEETDGATTFSDVSGYTHNGACQGGNCPAAGHLGRYGNAAVFDGSGDYLNAGSGITLTNESFTVAFWAKRDATGSRNMFVFGQGSSSANHALQLGFRSNNTFTCGFYDNDLATSTAYADQNWHHWACTYDATTQKRIIYRDGAQVAQDTASANYQGSGDTFIGKAPWGDTFSGRLDELAVFAKALSQSDVQAAMDARYNYNDSIVKPGQTITYEGTVTNKLFNRYVNGLLTTDFPGAMQDNVPPASFILQPAETQIMPGDVTVKSGATSGKAILSQVAGGIVVDRRQESGYAELWLPFNEGSGATTFSDFSGNMPARNGVCSGSACPQAGEKGVIGNAAKFDGSNDALNSGNRIDLAGKSFTVAFWAKRDATGARNMFVIGQGTKSTNHALQLGFRANNKFTCGFYGNDLDTDATYTDQNWHHWACTYDAAGGSRTIYRDGLEVGGDWHYASSGYKGSGNLYVGKAPWGDYFSGAVDDVRIYARVFSADEIAGLAGVPVLKMSLDESGSQFFAAGVDQNASCSGSGCPSPTGGISGRARNFDGNDYITLSSGVPDLRNQSFTFSIWINPQNSDHWQGIWGSDFEGALGYPGMAIKGQDLRFGFGNEAEWIERITTNAVTLNTWNHVVVTFDGTTYRLYVDGVKKDETGDTFSGQQVDYVINKLDLGRATNNSTGTVYLDHLRITDEGDGSGNAELCIAWRDRPGGELRRIWSNHDVDTGNYDIKKSLDFQTEGYLRIWEDDGGTYCGNRQDDGDDFVWEHTFSIYDPAITGTQNFYTSSSNDTKGYIWWGNQNTPAFQPPPSLPFKGKIDEFAIYKRALSTEYVQTLYESYVTALHLPFDEPPGAGLSQQGFANVVDFTGQNKGTCSGDACPTSGVTGRVNQAALFDGSNDYVDAGAVDVRNSSITLSAWAKRNSTGSYDYIIGQGSDTANQGLQFGFRPDNTFTCAFWGNDLNSPAYTDTDWHYWACTYDITGHRRAIYRDGAEVAFDYTTSAYQGSGTLFIGKFPGGSGYEFDGMIDDVAIYRRTLSSSEISALYQAAPSTLLSFNEPEGATRFSDNSGNNHNATCGLKQSGHYSLATDIRDIAISGNYAYVVDLFNKMNVLNISNPSSPALVSQYDLPGNDVGVAVSGNYAYIATGSTGLRVLDVSYPANLVEKGYYDTWWDARDVVVSGHYAYVAGDSGGLRVLDVSNPARPTEVGNYATLGTANRVAIVGSNVYVAGNWSDIVTLQVVDVSNPAQPKATGGHFESPGTPQGLLVDGSYVYLANGASGLRIADTSDTANLTGAGYLDTAGNALDVAVRGTEAYVADANNGLRVIDVSSPGQPREVSSYGTSVSARSVTMAGSTIYLGDGSTLRILSNACPKAGTRGQMGSAVEFNGQGDYLKVTDAGALGLKDSSFTVMAWIRGSQFADSGSNAILGTDETSNNNGLHLEVRNGKPYMGFYGNDTPGTIEIKPDILYHLAWRYDRDKGEQAIFVNGHLDQAKTGHGSFQGGGTVYVGRALGSHYFAGRIDELAIYPSALSAHAISDLFLYQGRWIEESESHEITIDADNPTSKLSSYLEGDSNYRPNTDVIFGIQVSDPTSSVKLAELGVRKDGQSSFTWVGAAACQDSADAAWCPTFNPADFGGEGTYTFQTRATDATGHRESPSDTYTFYVDGTPPNLSTTVADGALLVPYPHPTQPNTWLLSLSGTVDDPNLSSGVAGSDVDPDSVRVSLVDADDQLAGGTVQAVTLAGSQWSVEYPLYQGNPTGVYTLTMKAADNVGNNVSTILATFQVDATPSGAELDLDAVSANVISDTVTLRGTAQDTPSLPAALLRLHLDEAAGSRTFIDTSGRGNHATCSACPTAGEIGKFGKALQFNGANSATLLNSLDFAKADYTVAAWFKSGAAATQDILTAATAAGQPGIRLQLGSDGKLHYLHRFPADSTTGSEIVSSRASNDNAWHHLAAVRSGSKLSLYLDGVVIASGNDSSAATNALAVTLGQNFNGLLDDVQVFDRALTVSDIRGLAQTQVSGVAGVDIAFTPRSGSAPFYNGSNGDPQLHLPFEQNFATEGASLPNTADETRPATLHSGSGDATNKVVFGAVGSYALQLDGVDDYLSVDNGADLTADQLSVCAWVKPQAGNPAGAVIAQRWGSSGANWALRMGNSGFAWQHSAISTYNNMQSAAPVAGQWYYLCGVADDIQQLLYVNGEKVNAGWSNSAAGSGTGLNLGRRVGSSANYFKGAIDDVRLYRRPISADEVNALYHSGWQPTDYSSGVQAQTAESPEIIAARAQASSNLACQTYTSSDTPMAINDHQTSLSSIAVPDDFSVDDINLTVNIQHTWDADLSGYLIAPNGEQVTLFNRRGGSGDNYTNTELDDEAATIISSGSAPFSGQFRPESAFSALEGQSAQGTWQLQVDDQAWGDQGQIIGWSLELCSPPVPPPPPILAAAGSYDTPGYAKDVAVVGNYAYVADWASGLRVVDISNPASLSEVGSYVSTAWGWPSKVTVAGNYAYVANYVMSGSVGLRVVNISNPANITEVGSYDPPGYVKDIAVAGNHAYVADDNQGLRVVDISNPASPSEVGSYVTPGNAYGVAVAGSYAYMVNGYYGLRVIDISTPASPSEVGSYDTPGYAKGVAVAGNYAYVADYYSGLRVIDISTPANPIEVGFYDTPGYALNVTVAGDYAFIANAYDGVWVVDISDPAHPVKADSYDTPGYAQGVVVTGSHVYVADGGDGLVVLSAQIPTPPAFTPPANWSYDVPAGLEGAYQVDLRGRDNAGLLDTSTNSRNLWNGEIDTLTPRVDISRQVVGDKFRYTSSAEDYNLTADRFNSICGAGVYDQPDYVPGVPGDSEHQRLFRLSAQCDFDVPPMEQVGSYDTDGKTYDVALSGSHLYVADNQEGLRVLDVSDPRAPREVGHFKLGPDEQTHNAYSKNYFSGVDVSGDYAYLSDDSYWRIINIADPTAPREEGHYILRQNFYTGGRAGVYGNYAYIPDVSQRRLDVLDISDPTNPAKAGTTAVAAGSKHTCALTAAGGVKCWGLDYYGQLGTGGVGSPTTPADVVGLSSGVTAIAAGELHTCALTAGGGVKCWGYNAYGQVGDGTTTVRYTPVDVVGLSSGVTAISAGAYHTCALTTGGGVKCWGANGWGTLGDGTTTSRYTPVDVSGLNSGVIAISAGASHTCALTTGGAVKCWGYNGYGQVGDGSVSNRYTPVNVVGLGSGVTAIAVGGNHTCALTTGGGVKCWGYNEYGQVGDGTTNQRNTPVAVSGAGSSIKAITAGGYHTCALFSINGWFRCWGYNGDGQLGDGTTTNRSTPVDVSGSAGTNGFGYLVTDISGGGSHTCALTTTGLKCWGYNYSGQLGDGTRTSRTTPVDVVGLPVGEVDLPVGTYGSGPVKVIVEGDYAYVTALFDGLIIVDLSNPANPQVVGHYTGPITSWGVPYAIEDVAISGNYAYVAQTWAGLVVLDIRNKSNPYKVGQLNPPNTYMNGVSLSGTYAYMVDNWGGAWLVDIVNPRSPAVVRNYHLDMKYSAVVADGNLAYIAAREDGVRVAYSDLRPATESITACDTFDHCVTKSITETHPLLMSSLAQTAAPVAVSLMNGVDAVLDNTDPLTITGSAQADNFLQSLTATVNGAPLYSDNWAVTETITNTRFSFGWTPPGEGNYLLDITAGDWLTNTASYTQTVIVDTTPPAISIATDVLTGTDYVAAGQLDITGLVTDTNLNYVDVTITGDSDSVSGRATATGGPSPGSGQAWSYTWKINQAAPPDNLAYTVTVTAIDVAGWETSASRHIIVDVAAPAPVELSVSTSSGTITPTATLRQISPTLTLTWTQSSSKDLTGYQVGWLAQTSGYTQTTATWQSFTAGDPRTTQYTAGEAQKLDIQFAGQDALGNQRWQSFGPVYVDGPLTPDYVDLPSTAGGGLYHGWMDSGCTLIGTDNRIRDKAQKGAALDDAQQLYATWDASGLRLAWTGADWNTDGDLFIYLDTQPGGSVRAYDPYTATQHNTVILLPENSNQIAAASSQMAAAGEMSHRAALKALIAQQAATRMAADTMVWVQDSGTATLLRWDDTLEAWQAVDGAFGYVLSPGDVSTTDLYLPFDLIGVSDPTNGDLSLVAFATEDDGLRLWATLPTRNNVNSPRILDAVITAGVQEFPLTHGYAWSSLGSGVCVNGTQPNTQYAAHSTQYAAQPTSRFTGADVRLFLSGDPTGIAYSVLGDNLFFAMSSLDQFAGSADWNTILVDLCQSNPGAPECGRQAGGASPANTQTPSTADLLPSKQLLAQQDQIPAPPGYGGSLQSLRLATGSSQNDFDAQEGLSSLMDVDNPPLGDGQEVTFTLRYVNQGSGTATGLMADIVTWGPMRLPDGTPLSDSQGDYDWLLLPLGDLAAGEEKTISFRGGADLSYDPGNRNGWATIDVVIYDDTGSVYNNQLDWLYMDFQYDDKPPALGVSSLPALLGPGMNGVGGFAFDASGVPSIDLNTGDQSWNCSDDTPGNGTWNCAWDVSGAGEGDTFNLQARGTDAHGLVGPWSNWQVFTVDATPPQISFDAATEDALSDGLIGANETTFSGQLTDNRLVNRVEALDDHGAPDAVAADLLVDANTLPQNVYTYEDVPETPIPLGARTACFGGTEIYRSFTVPDSFIVADVDLGLNVDHDYRYDVTGWLLAPSGRWAAILWNGTAAHNYDMLLNDDAVFAVGKDRMNHDSGIPYYENIRRPDQPLSLFNGEPAQGDWQLILCDYFPNEDDGFYNRSQLVLTADTLPQNTDGAWSFALPNVTGQDNITRTVILSGVDSVGNRSAQPLVRTFSVDTVAPAITVTQAITETPFTYTGVVFSGTVSDGSAVTDLRALITQPDGSIHTDLVVVDGGDWRYTPSMPLTPGAYALRIQATDAAGNLATVGPFDFDATCIAATPMVTAVAAEPDATFPFSVTLTAVISNTGETLPANLPVGFYVDGELVGAVSTTRTLGDGDREVLSLTWNAEFQGDYEVSVTANADAANGALALCSVAPGARQTVSLLDVPLAKDWNLISSYVNPFNTDIEVVQRPIAGQVVLIQGFDRDVKSYDPALPPAANTLHTLDARHGYWIKASGDQTPAAVLRVVGVKWAEDHPLVLDAGWNLLSYLPRQSLSITTALQSIAGQYSAVLTFDQGAASYYPMLGDGYNTLSQMEPDHGYWIKVKQPVTLTYPTNADLGSATAGSLSQPGEIESPAIHNPNSEVVHPTNTWVNFYGGAHWPNGRVLPLGTTVQAMDADGVICGTTVISHVGQYGLLACYGDDPTTPADEGAQPGDMIRLMAGGQKLALGTWTSHGDLQLVPLMSLYLERLWLPLSLKSNNSAQAAGEPIATPEEAVQTPEPQVPPASIPTPESLTVPLWLPFIQSSALTGQAAAPTATPTVPPEPPAIPTPEDQTQPLWLPLIQSGADPAATSSMHTGGQLWTRTASRLSSMIRAWLPLSLINPFSATYVLGEGK